MLTLERRWFDILYFSFDNTSFDETRDTIESFFVSRKTQELMTAIWKLKKFHCSLLFFVEPFVALQIWPCNPKEKQQNF